MCSSLVGGQPDSSHQPLCIVGAGSLGQTFAAMLARSGQLVTLLSTPATAARLLDSGFIRIRGAERLDVPVARPPAAAGTVAITDDPADLPADVGLLFTTKAHHLASAATAVRAAWPRSGDDTSWVAGLQNGLYKDDVLAEAFGTDRVVGAVTITSAERRENGEILFTSPGVSYLGSFDPRQAGRVHVATSMLHEAGLPAEPTADIRSVLWTKACNAAGIFGVSLLTRVAGAGLLASEARARAYVSLIKETAEIGQAEGVETADLPRFPPIRTYVDQPADESVRALVTARAAADGALAPTPSMLQDLFAGRGLEVEEVFGDLVRRSQRSGVSAPRLEVVTELLRGVDPLR